MSKIKDALKKAKAARQHAAASPETRMPVATREPPATVHHTRIINYSENAAKKHKLITPFLKDPALTERLKLLRTKVFTETHGKNERTILITSTMRHEGKTFIAANLAITFAREVDQTVMLVDANLQNPSVLKVFGIQAQQGLSNYLLEDVPIPDLLIRPGIEKLVLLPAGKPAGKPVENSAELLRSLKMQDLVREMKNRYGDRYIFFDAPAITSSVDAIILSQYVDKTLLVVESGKVKPEKLTAAINNLEKSKLLGTILNKTNPAML